VPTQIKMFGFLWNNDNELHNDCKILSSWFDLTLQIPKLCTLLQLYILGYTLAHPSSWSLQVEPQNMQLLTDITKCIICIYRQWLYLHCWRNLLLLGSQLVDGSWKAKVDPINSLFFVALVGLPHPSIRSYHIVVWCIHPLTVNYDLELPCTIGHLHPIKIEVCHKL